MSDSITIAVVPRESFDLVPRVIERIYEVTELDFQMLVVEGHAPEPVRAELRRLESAHENLEVLWSDRWLLPHEALELARERFTTDYLLIIDNDVEVAPGWLEALVSCAKAEGAACVHPLYLATTLDDPYPTVHVAEGTIARREVDGREVITSITMTGSGTPLSAYQDAERSHSDFFEWHCVLLHRRALAILAPFPDLNVFLHTDGSLRLREAGETIWFEPAAVVAYDTRRLSGLSGVDRDYLLYRWDLERTERSISTFAARWPVDPEVIARKRHWARARLRPLTSTFGALADKIERAGLRLSRAIRPSVQT